MSPYWECVREGQPLAGVDVVDLHGHLGRCLVPSGDVSLATKIQVMDRLGVACAVVSHTQCMSWDMAAGNDFVHEAMQAFPGRILGYVVLWPGYPQAVRRETEQRLGQGFVGLKLHNANGFRYTDPGYEPALTLANERSLPILLHTWGDLYGDPTLDDVRLLATRYPSAAFLLAHAGVCAEDKYVALAREFSNVYLDPTMSRTPRGLWERLVAAVGPEKLVWGSDAPFYSMTPHLGKVAGANLPDEAKRLILGGNARQLLSRARVEPLHLHPVFHDADIFNQGKPTTVAFGQRDVRQGPGTLPVSERIDEIAFSIPAFKQDAPDAIAAYARAFRKVAEHAQELRAGPASVSQEPCEMIERSERTIAVRDGYVMKYTQSRKYGLAWTAPAVLAGLMLVTANGATGRSEALNQKSQRKDDGNMSTNSIPILLDTDIGSDIDDAVCLSYLLRQPRCELLGITTVSGMARERAALADAVCRAAGRTNIPIFAGTEVGVATGAIVQPSCAQAAVLARLPHRKPEDFEPNAAVEFLRRTIRSRPGEITLLAIGPMTNLALLFEADPEIPGLLKQVMVMCGTFHFRAPYPDPCLVEWNALCDPMATKLLYLAPVRDHRSVGLDVTTRCTLPTDECMARFKAIGGPLAVVAAMTEVWSQHAKIVTFHDPLAAACLFNPGICTWRSGLVSVVTGTGIVDGMTVLDWRSQQKPHAVAETVDSQAFLKEYFAVVGEK